MWKWKMIFWYAPWHFLEKKRTDMLRFRQYFAFFAFSIKNQVILFGVSCFFLNFAAINFDSMKKLALPTFSRHGRVFKQVWTLLIWLNENVQINIRIGQHGTAEQCEPYKGGGKSLNSLLVVFAVFFDLICFHSICTIFR